MGNNPSTLADEDTGDEVASASQASPTKQQQVPAGTRLGTAKLYEHVGGVGPGGKWVVSQQAVTPRFLGQGEEEEDEEAEGDDEGGSQKLWTLVVPPKIAGVVSDELSMRFNPTQKRADFVVNGVWALKFNTQEAYEEFVKEYQACMWENIHGVDYTDANVAQVAGKDFTGWMQGKDNEEQMWDAEEEQPVTPRQVQPRETGKTSTPSKAQSLAMGAARNSYVLHGGGLGVFRNTAEGLMSDDTTVELKTPQGFLTPKKAMLMRGESQMMLLSPQQKLQQAQSVHQLDIETGKVVTEWKFEKDGTGIGIKDITNDTKSAQLDDSVSSFLGLDDNRLCRWDMRDRRGVVQTLEWDNGHNFSRGTNFQCMASTGDGSIAIGSKDGKVRLYGTTSMRQAKTAFPGLGAPITNVDVTYDGRWILATTDTYVMLISTVFRDKNNKEKTGFEARMGSNIAAPRLLKLSPVHAAAAGPGHKFHGAQFSWVTEQGRQERNIVVSVGNYSVVWNFRRVKQSNHECYLHQTGLKTCYCYKIMPKTDSIISSRFMHDNFHGAASPEAPLIVATPDEVSTFNVAQS